MYILNYDKLIFNNESFVLLVRYYFLLDSTIFTIEYNPKVYIVIFVQIIIYDFYI